MPRKYEAILIGGSWGGMDAVIKILSGVPANYPIPIIVILHRKKDTKSELTSVIQNKLLLKVKEIEEKEKINPGQVYIAPANYHVLIEEEKTFSLDVSERVNHSRPSIDVTFESGAEVYKDKLIGIILTGANKDGSLGLNIVSKSGGLAIVQDPLEAEIETMPKAALLKTPEVNHIFRLEQIKAFLLNL